MLTPTSFLPPPVPFSATQLGQSNPKVKQPEVLQNIPKQRMGKNTPKQKESNAIHLTEQQLVAIYRVLHSQRTQQNAQIDNIGKRLTSTKKALKHAQEVLAKAKNRAATKEKAAENAKKSVINKFDDSETIGFNSRKYKSQHTVNSKAHRKAHSKAHAVAKTATKARASFQQSEKIINELSQNVASLQAKHMIQVKQRHSLDNEIKQLQHSILSTRTKKTNIRLTPLASQILQELQTAP